MGDMKDAFYIGVDHLIPFCRDSVLQLVSPAPKSVSYTHLDVYKRQVHDGVAIFESAAIQLYLGELFGVAKGLYPAPGPKRGEVMKWIVWTNVTLGEAMSRLGRNVGQWAPEDERNAKAGATAKADIMGLLQIVENTLQGRPYLTGETFTLADLHLASWIDYVRMMQIDLTPYPMLSLIHI